MIHKEGKESIIIISLITLILWVLGLDLFPNNQTIHNIILVFDLGALIFIIQFFRNPRREILKILKGEILCPADGEILVLEKTIENEFLGKEVTQVSIFMSPFNIHKNLNPINGIIEKIVYHPGKFLVAYNPKSSTDNERCSYLYLSPEKDNLVMRQIAGAVARRIVYYLKEHQMVKAGVEMGFIKFGSRVDLFIPENFEILINLNQKVKAGQTLIARRKY
jgi:phosphatidylserine decarboxylase